MADKKGGLLIMIGGPKGAADKMGSADSSDKSMGYANEDDEASNSDMAKEQAAKALIRGVKNGDVQAVNDALEAHYEACSASKG